MRREKTIQINLRAYSCTVKGTDWSRTVHALSASKARYDYWLDVKDAWPDVPFIDVRCRVLGKPRDTEHFQHTAKYRGVTFHMGDRVRVGDSIGFVGESNSSANFNVHFIEGKWAGCVLNCHPSEIEVIHAD